MGYGNGKGSGSYGAGRLPAFSSMAAKWALAIGLGIAAIGGYEAIQSARATAWQGDAEAAAKKVAGASKVKGRELEALAKHEASSADALNELGSKAEAMEFLVGRAVPDLASARERLISAERARIEGSAASESAISAALAARAAGKMSNGDFIDAASEALAGLPKDARPFSGPEGFASQPLADFEAQARSMSQEADEKLALLKEELPARAKLLDEESSQKAVDENAKRALAEAQQAAAAEAEQQIEGYRQQVKQAASKAFDSEGESMGDSDWSDINNDLESDGDWQSAKQGLRAAAGASALQAAEIARDQWDDEREHAVALAQAVAAQPDAVSHMSIWEMALLAQWIDNSSPRTVVVYSEPMRQVGARYAGQRSLVAAPIASFVRQGYSMGAEPKAGFDGASALRMSRGESVQAPRPRYASSVAAAAIAGEVAAGRGDMAKVGRLSAAMSKAQASAQAAPAAGSARPQPAAPVQIQAQVPVGKFAPPAAPGAARDYSARAPAGFSWSPSASSVAARAAQSASAKAASVAATAAVRSAAGKAAQSAAQGAAAKASTLAASKAAQAAAGTAASKAAQSAAQSAAARAAQSAASKAASAAASRAASAAASRAASQAAAKAAQAASNKASQASSSRASQSSSRSSSSGRR